MRETKNKTYCPPIAISAPFFCQTIFGVGTPVAWQENVTSSPTRTVFGTGFTVITAFCGGPRTYWDHSHE